jgi:hypothetical protein
MHDVLEALTQTAAALTPPRTQAEWRRASTILRLARREALSLNRACDVHVLCGGWYRRIRVGTWERVGVYNGPSPITDGLMIAFHRRQHMAGIGLSRLADAQIFAQRSREAGPVRLP